MKRKHNEMSELSPKVEAKDMEFVLTRCAFSSVGRATDSYSVGPRFESVKVHQVVLSRTLGASWAGTAERGATMARWSSG